MGVGRSAMVNVDGQATVNFNGVVFGICSFSYSHRDEVLLFYVPGLPQHVVQAIKDSNDNPQTAFNSQEAL